MHEHTTDFLLTYKCKYNKLLIYAYVKTQQIPTYVYVLEQGFLNKITNTQNGFLTYVYAYL